MQTSRTIEAEARAALEAFLLAGEQPGPGAIEAVLAHVADDVTGVGTGPGDRYADRAALAGSLQRERERNPATGSSHVSTTHARVLGADAALVEGDVRFSIDMRGATHVVELRCTAVVERRGGRWLLTHFHFSLPNGQQGEGDALLDALGERNRQLEAEVARRTAELERALADLQTAQARLVHQETMASLGALTAGIAHELKNPLNFIVNFASLSRELADDLRQALAAGDAPEAEALLGDLAANAEAIEEHGTRADAVVRAMMDHGRGGAGARAPADLNAVVRHYARLAEHEAEHTCGGREGPTVAVALDLDSAVGTVEVIAVEVGRVVVSLIQNAVHAVRERVRVASGAYAPVVTVSTRRTDGGVEIVVEDNGAGMPPSVRARAFEPFFTTKPPGEGTGLGLSLAHDVIVKGHGGTIRVESEDGQGTSVVVSVPT